MRPSALHNQSKTSQENGYLTWLHSLFVGHRPHYEPQPSWRLIPLDQGSTTKDLLICALVSKMLAL